MGVNQKQKVFRVLKTCGACGILFQVKSDSRRRVCVDCRRGRGR